MEFSLIENIVCVLWCIEFVILLLFYVFLVFERFYSETIFRGFLIIFILCSSIITFLFPFFETLDNIIFFCLFLLALPFGLNTANVAEKYLKDKRIKKDKEEIRNIFKQLKKEKGDAGLYMRLGYLYKDMEDYENALQNFKKARELTKDISTPVTTNEIRTMAKEINRHKKREKDICKHCGTYNYPTRLICENCKKQLYPSMIAYFKKLLKITIGTGPLITTLIIIIIISAILFAVYIALIPNLIIWGLLLANVTMFKTNFIKGKWVDH